MKITFIGAGKIGGAAARGIAASHVVEPDDITVTARHAKSLAGFRKYGIRTSLNNAEAVSDTDIVFFCLKPWQMEEVIREVRDRLDYSRQTIVSTAPGVSSAKLLEWLGKPGQEPGLAYVIPNTAIEICESMTFISPVTATEEQTATLKRIFDHTGKAMVIPESQMLAEQMHRVTLYADPRAYAALDGRYPADKLQKAGEDAFGTEYMDYKMAVKTVDSLDEALAHIDRYGSGHSESIITEDSAAASRFLQEVDAACVYHNAPTSFTDGAQFGLGAEIGISTQKLGARGPMGLEEITSYKWIVTGNGQTRK